jgi:hypothetical protein
MRRMVGIRYGIGLACVVLAVACGPGVGEMRMQSYPSRGANCELEFVKLDMQDLSSPTGKWEMIGYVTLGDNGKLDPFSDENRALVRPRACDMGGEAVTIANSASNETLLSTGSAVSYGILRHREAKDAAPKKF